MKKNKLNAADILSRITSSQYKIVTTIIGFHIVIFCPSINRAPIRKKELNHTNKKKNR